MNRHRHRVVFNAARGLRMVVAECARSVGPGSAGGGLLATALLMTRLIALPLTLVAPAAQAQILTDRSAPGHQRPTVLGTANGVPLINIQTPSAGGVSLNRYSQFDIGPQGTILNNSRKGANTHIGGAVPGNPWLGLQAARVIVNQVNSSNPSHLRGPLEVAGQRAEVIVANPSGIQVNGGRFINALGVTLTTGVPVNLRIESLQDRATYREKSKQAGASATFGAGAGGSFSASRTNIESEYASVNEQSGIRSGDGGFNVKVQGKTVLKGGAITSTQVAVVKRETTGKVVAAQVAFNILMLATGGGGGFQTFSKNELKGDRIESPQRDNLRNPTSTDFVRRLDDRVQVAMNADETMRQRAFEYPLVVAGGNARLVCDALAGTGEEKFALKTRLQIYKRKEATSLWSPSVIVDCAEASGEPLPQAEWAANDYALVRTSLQSMLDACEGAVLARLPELLKE